MNKLTSNLSSEAQQPDKAAILSFLREQQLQNSNQLRVPSTPDKVEMLKRQAEAIENAILIAEKADFDNYQSQI